MMRAALALLLRDVELALREGGAIGTALGFYLVVVAITPLGLGPDLNLLSRIAPGMLWVALLLAALLSADRIFHNDYEDGALDVLITGPLPLAARRRHQEPRPLAHHRRAAGADRAAARAAAQSAAPGDPAARAVDARRHAGRELRRRHRREPDLGLRRSGLLLALLVLPLYVPVLIFGVATASAAITGPASPWPPFLHAVRVEPRQHRARAARRRRRAPQCAAVNYLQSCHSATARHDPNTKRVPV